MAMDFHAAVWNSGGILGHKEVRITAISEYGFQTRLAMPATEEQKNAPWELAFYDQKTASYHRIMLMMQLFTGEKRKILIGLYVWYRAGKLSKTRYSALPCSTVSISAGKSRTMMPLLQTDDWLSCGAGRVSSGKSGRAEKVWFCGIGKETFVALQNGSAGSGQPVELALELDRPEWYTAYLSMESAAFFETYFRKNQIPDPPIFHPDRLYIGNSFCPHLAPKEEELFAMMDKACRESFAVTLVFPFLLEENLPETQERLYHLARWCEQKNKTIELVVNDWGTAQLAAQFSAFSLCLGVLLNKRKKDPRMAYKMGDRTLFEKNSVHAAFYRDYLKEKFRIERYEWESCGDTSIRKFPEGKNSLHLPFYQTNTSQYCPQYAACVKGSRGAQVPVRECPGFCEKQVFLYPEHLRMVGRYNSLFGVDLDVWRRMEEMLELCGTNRVVVNLV